MTLLIGALISVLIQIGKWLIGKLGREAANFVILFAVFVLALAYSLLLYKGIVTPELIKTVVLIFSVAIATYETILKWIMPAYNALFGEKKSRTKSRPDAIWRGPLACDNIILDHNGFDF
jgi:hypothetical protein